MSAFDAEHKHEIIIVRRGHDDHDEGHHGGAWKIAFADFMTALMCFFLVMWLINAANEQTKAAVASYFNPIQLIDRNSSRKGLDNIGDGPSDVGLTANDPQDAATKAGDAGKGNAGDAPKKTDKSKAASESPKAGDAASADARLFADPYAVLSEIAADTGTMQNVSDKGDGGAQIAGPATGADGGESYRDPFAPDFWSQQVAAPAAEASAERPKIDGDPAKPGDKAAETAVPKVKREPQPPATPAPGSQVAADTAAQASTAKPQPVQEAAGTEPKADKAPNAATIQAAAQVRKQIAAVLGSDKIAEGVTVEATDQGVAISVTDKLDFGMFEIGSAVPKRDLVLAMEKIARVVNTQKGQITIQGHTDARPFKGGGYDNWRLSSARAQSAYYMLVRGGVDEDRIREVAGFADREPKDRTDPLAAVNRRIEILVATPG